MSTNTRENVDVESQLPGVVNAQLERMTTELTRCDKAAQEAQAKLNHQLRTGLNDILGFAELLEMRTDHDDRESIQQILRAGRQMLDLIGEKLPLPDDRFAPAPSQRSSETAERRDVLYLEDNDANFRLVCRILQARPNIKLRRGERGATALTLAHEHRPHLILLDLNLPDISGAEVLRRLREQPETESIPVVVISADATPSQIERLLAAGARNYLTKPFSIKVLLAVVDEVLEQSAGHSA